MARGSRNQRRMEQARALSSLTAERDAQDAAQEELDKAQAALLSANVAMRERAEKAEAERDEAKRQSNEWSERAINLASKLTQAEAELAELARQLAQSDACVAYWTAGYSEALWHSHPLNEWREQAVARYHAGRQSASEKKDT